jgi:cbb3-type cytochrome oxidase subunit 3
VNENFWIIVLTLGYPVIAFIWWMLTKENKL